MKVESTTFSSSAESRFAFSSHLEINAKFLETLDQAGGVDDSV